MYKARMFYKKDNGDVLRYQIIRNGNPLPIDDDVLITSEVSDISVDNIGYFEWDNPENELETILSENKVVKVDISQTPPVIYGEEPEIIEPSEDDPISGVEFLSMVEGVL